jgi:hypothetical protein
MYYIYNILIVFSLSSYTYFALFCYTNFDMFYILWPYVVALNENKNQSISNFLNHNVFISNEATILCNGICFTRQHISSWIYILYESRFYFCK